MNNGKPLRSRFDKREVFEPCHCGVLVGGGIIGVLFLKELYFVILTGKSANDAVAGNIFLSTGVQVGKFFTERYIFWSYFLAEDAGYNEYERSKRQ